MRRPAFNILRPSLRLGFILSVSTGLCLASGAGTAAVASDSNEITAASVDRPSVEELLPETIVSDDAPATASERGLVFDSQRRY